MPGRRIMDHTPACLIIIDDHRMFADGFVALNDASERPYDIHVYDAPDLFLKALADGLSADLFILDLVMKQMNGLAVLSALRQHGSKAPVLMLSGMADSPPLAEMRALGANGFLHKSAGQDDLLSAIERLLAGGTLFASELSEHADALASDFQPPVLAARQQQVLSLISQGATNRDISQTLGISENTVKSHLRALYETLGANTRTGAVRKAQQLGLI